jgi:hypothetical protein
MEKQLPGSLNLIHSVMDCSTEEETSQENNPVEESIPTEDQTEET